ncbi:MAG: hypothetical protein GX587_04925 [Bacteroidales bacterium]|nr:hypothetical protein [Bacteroidales bacterium]
MAKDKDLGGIFKLSTQMFAENYHKAVNNVLNNPAPDSPLYPYACQFQHNTANLAAWKAYRLANELTSLTNDEDIKLAIKKYNQWQAVEYNAITARTRTARQLLDFKKRANIYPNLKWVRSRSANPREGHLSLVGLVLPYNDPFWASNQPGSLYGCKCDWVQTDEPVSGQIPEAVTPSPGLDGNPLLTGELITRKAGHFKAYANKNIVPQIIECLGENQWTNFKAKDGFNLQTHLLHGSLELKENIEMINLFSSVNKDIASCKLLPIIYKDEQNIKKAFYPKKQYPLDVRRNADALITMKDGQEWVTDFKITTGNNLKRILSDAAKQAKYAVIKLEANSEVKIDEIKGRVDYITESKRLNEVFVFDHAGILVYKASKNTTAEKQ